MTTFRIDPNRSKVWIEARSSMHPIHGEADGLEGSIEADVADGQLVSTLEDWCAPFSGYHLYYPSRRQLAPAFAVIVEALRYRHR